TPPVAQITAPADGSTYRDGVPVTLTGRATDAQDGTEPGSRLAWTVIVHHLDHIHILATPPNGTTATFTPVTDHTANASYEIDLQATDASGATSTLTSITLHPQTVGVTLGSSPAGVPIGFAGVPEGAGTYTHAIGFTTTLSAPTTATVNNREYLFDH